MNLNLKSLFFSLRRSLSDLSPGPGRQNYQYRLYALLSGRHSRAVVYRLESGVLGITRLLANEWALHGINVNAIAPGYMATNNTQQLRDNEQRNAEILTASRRVDGEYRMTFRGRSSFSLPHQIT